MARKCSSGTLFSWLIRFPPDNFPEKPAGKTTEHKSNYGFIGEVQGSVSVEKIFHRNDYGGHGPEGDRGANNHYSEQTFLMIGFTHKVFSRRFGSIGSSCLHGRTASLTRRDMRGGTPPFESLAETIHVQIDDGSCIE